MTLEQLILPLIGLVVAVVFALAAVWWKTR